MGRFKLKNSSKGIVGAGLELGLRLDLEPALLCLWFLLGLVLDLDIGFSLKLGLVLALNLLLGPGLELGLMLGLGSGLLLGFIWY